MFIDGQWVEGSSVWGVKEPSTGETCATVAYGGVSYTDRAIEAATRAHTEGVWRKKTPAERADVLDRIHQILSAKVEDLAHLVASENGATVRCATAFHVGVALGSLKYFADQTRVYEFRKANEPTQLPLPAQGYIHRDPVGVVGAILPFNFPLVLGIWKIGPALAAGNTIVVKPDENTPQTLLEFAKAAEEAGLPPGVFNVVLGDGEAVGGRLAEHPGIRKIAFTGSTEVGKIVMRGAASNVKKVTLELGGKGPSIILDDANLDLAVRGSLFAFLMYNGQVCESGTRTFVPRALYDDVVQLMVEATKTLKIGDPHDPDTDFGPIIDQEAVDRIQQMVAHAVEQGATVAYRGALDLDEKFRGGTWVAPVILSNVTNEMDIARNEAFGPVGVVIPYDTVEEAIEMANDSEYGLAAGVWGGDEERAIDVASQLEAGTVWVNDWHMFPLTGPFGGFKQSGLGRELGAHAFDEYTEEKYIHVAANQDLQQRAYGLLFGHS
ncbi:aldehyde dehydrogenase family protein [Flexivirga caeni]|nr:aldehyde dehydrogenase family protein [Flexivirga caeni]